MRTKRPRVSEKEESRNCREWWAVFIPLLMDGKAYLKLEHERPREINAKCTKATPTLLLSESFTAQ